MRVLSIIVTIVMTALQTSWAQNPGLFQKQTETDYSEFEITHEYFAPNGIAPSASGGYDMTGYIPVKGGDVIVFSGDRSPGIPFMMGYTDNEGNGSSLLLGNFDQADYSDLNVTEEEVTIPAGISYVRCSARNTTLPGWASRNMSVIKRSQTNEPRTVRILAIGNSFTIDAFESSIYDIAKAQGIELVLGNACYAGYSLESHWNGLVTDLANLEYRKCVDRHYTVEKGYTLSSILSDEPWDFITFQQASSQAGFYETYEPWLTNLIDNIKAYVPNPNVKYGFYMIWAYGQDSPSVNFPRYDRNQMTMYNSIVNATQKVMNTHPELEFLIPTGTAIQNLRTSFVGDNLTRDGAHLTLELGRATAAYSWYAVLFGEEMTRQNTYTPYNLNEFSTTMVKNTAIAALHNPYSITPQNYPDYTGDNTIIPSDIYFNFSYRGTETDGWNDVTLYDEFAGGFKDTTGKDCGIIIRSNDHFCSANTIGATDTDTPLYMPSDVSQTALWGYSEGNLNDVPQTPTTTFYFKHLNKSLKYDFTFFSSRAYSTDNRETQFTLAGTDTQTATLNASSNKNNTVTISGMQPDNEGTITLTVQAGPNNNNSYKFYYLNALRIFAYDPREPDNLQQITKRDNNCRARKYIKDKHLYIIKDNKTYSIDGKEIMKNEVMN